MHEMFLIEPPGYPPRLQHEFDARGVEFDRRRIEHVYELDTVSGHALLGCLESGRAHRSTMERWCR